MTRTGGVETLCLGLPAPVVDSPSGLGPTRVGVLFGDLDVSNSRDLEHVSGVSLTPFVSDVPYKITSTGSELVHICLTDGV